MNMTTRFLQRRPMSLWMRFYGFICFCRLPCGVFSSRLEWYWGCQGADGMCRYRYALKSKSLSLPGHANTRTWFPQSAGFALTIGGYFLGHMHGGRKFPKSAHGTFANILMIFVAAQLVLGIYLKLHIHERSIRPYAVVLHGIVGKAYPIIGWTQMLFGAIAYMGYCRGGHLEQCLAHYIMVRISVVLVLLCLMLCYVLLREAASSLMPSLCRLCFLSERGGYDEKAEVQNFTILSSSCFGCAQVTLIILFCMLNGLV